MNILDFLTLASYVALNTDIVLQIRKIYKTKSSRDLSLVGLSVRYTAILVILIKFVETKEFTLIAGQSLLVLTFTTYLILAVYYFIHRK